MLTTKIDSPIISVEVVTTTKPTPIIMQEVTESLKRHKVLQGSTYQLKTPLSEYTWYITINDIVLNEGTEFERLQPFEIFFNTKDVTSYQWMVFTSRMISAIFRKGGDLNFIIEEMNAVYQPNGGYMSRDGYVPSLVAEIGKIIETHFKSIGLIKEIVVSDQVLAKKEEYLKVNANMDNAGLCSACGARAVIQFEGCGYCTSCNYSKCS